MFFVGELGASFGDEFGRSFLDVAGVAEALSQGIVLFFTLDDAIFEIVDVLSFDILWNLQVDVVVAGDGEVETACLLWFDLRDCRGLGEVLNKQLVGVHDFIVVEGHRISVSAWNGLVMAADISDDIDELCEVAGAFLIDFVELWPFGVDEHALSPGKILPDGFGDERRKGVQEDEDLLEGILQECGVLPKFLAFEEPVGVFVPNEVVEEVASFCEAVVGEKFLHFPVSFVDLVANPVFAVVYEFVGWFLLWVLGIVVDHLLDEARNVPKLVTEIARCNNLAYTEGLIDAGAARSDKAETKSVRAIFCNYGHRIDNVALGLRHLLTLFVEHHTVHVDILEWNVVGDVKAKHNHAANPLE